MSWVDLAIIVLAVAAGYGGYRLGFVTRVVSWTLLAAGLLLGTWLVPMALQSSSETASSDQTFLLAMLLLMILAAVGLVLGLLLGRLLSSRVQSHRGRRRDQISGAAAGVVGVLVLVWIVAPVMASVPGSTAGAARQSLIMRTVSQAVIGAPDVSRGMRALVRTHGPPVFAHTHPTPDLGPIPAAPDVPQEALDEISASVVKVEGRACGLVQEGTGFVVRSNLIITAAHVVAGQSTTFVTTPDGRRLTAQVLSFDPLRDVAFLQVNDLGLESLEISPPAISATGEVIGYPGGGDLEMSPFRVHDSVTAVGRDIYDRYPIKRAVLVLAADLSPGDSGAPIVTTEGDVIGMAIAIAPDRTDVAYGLPASELRQQTGAHIQDHSGSCIR